MPPRPRCKPRKYSDRVRSLEASVDHLALACQAMWELLRGQVGVTEEQLLAKMKEVDLRDGDYQLASAAPRLKSVVFLSPRSAEGSALLQPLSRRELLGRLAALQPYAAGQAHWKKFARAVASRGGFELRRGRHPVESVEALRAMLSSSSSAAGRSGET